MASQIAMLEPRSFAVRFLIQPRCKFQVHKLLRSFLQSLEKLQVPPGGLDHWGSGTGSVVRCAKLCRSLRNAEFRSSEFNRSTTESFAHQIHSMTFEALHRNNLLEGKKLSGFGFPVPVEDSSYVTAMLFLFVLHDISSLFTIDSHKTGKKSMDELPLLDKHGRNTLPQISRRYVKVPFSIIFYAPSVSGLKMTMLCVSYGRNHVLLCSILCIIHG